MERKNHTFLFLFAIALLLCACSRSAGGKATYTVVTTLLPPTVTSALKPSPQSTNTPAASPSVTLSPTSTLAPTSTEVPLPAWDWQIEAVDSGKQGLYPSLAIDPEDTPYIAYLDDAEDDLKIASYINGYWGIQAFESPNVDGFYPSLAIDNQGRPRVTRWIMSVRWLAYMPWMEQEGWKVTAFLPKLRIASTSLALDHAKVQVPHIVYFDIDAGEVMYARYRTSGWIVQSIDQTTADGVSFPLALDAADRPQVAYYKDQVGLVFAQQSEDGKTWETRVVDAGAGIGLYPALALDVKDMPHISYIDANQGSLKYAKFVNGEWDIQVVDGSGKASGATSIALSPQGDIHISYYDQADHALKHALGVGGRWQLTVVDNEGDVGLFNSLALDSSGDPHIGYYDRSSRSLKYASGR